MSKVASILFILISTSLSLSGQNQSPTITPTRTMLFVCEHGAARSTIAAAYFNKIAIEKRLNFHAIFRGTTPQDTLTAGTRRGLINDGFDVSKMKPLGVSKEDIDNAYQIITFDCELPGTFNARISESWNGIPPISEDYSVARNQIEKKVNELVTQLLKPYGIK